MKIFMVDALDRGIIYILTEYIIVLLKNVSDTVYQD